MYSLDRDAASNQRIGFDIEPCGRHLVSGGTHGKAQVFDLTDGLPCASIQVSEDTVNGVSLHPFAPLAAFSTGHRRYELSGLSDSDDDADVREACLLPISCNTIAIFSLGSTSYDGECAEGLGETEVTAEADQTRLVI